MCRQEKQMPFYTISMELYFPNYRTLSTYFICFGQITPQALCHSSEYHTITRNSEKPESIQASIN